MDTQKHPAIVIIDPNESSASVARSLLSQMGLDAQVIPGPADALLVQARLRLDLVIAACRKIGADFHAFLQALKLRNPNVEAIVACPAAQKLEAAGCLKTLVSGLVGYPLHPDELAICLPGALDRIRLRLQLQQEKRETARRLRRRYVKRIETERFLSVKQILDKVSTFIGELAREVEGGFRYFNEIPYFIAIHDRKCRIVAANLAYRTLLGRRIGDPSWEIYDGESRSRERCPVGRTLLSENALDLRETVCYRSGAGELFGECGGCLCR